MLPATSSLSAFLGVRSRGVAGSGNTDMRGSALEELRVCWGDNTLEMINGSVR